MKKTLAVFTMIIFVFPFAVSAEGNNNQSSTLIDNAMSKIRWNQLIKIKTFDNKEIKGKKQKIVTDTLYLKIENDKISIPVSDINTLWVQENRTKKGMVTGAFIGGAIGFGIGMYFRDFSIMGPSETHNERPVIGTLVGAGIGMMVFGSIGSVSKRWDERYSKEKNLSFNLLPVKNGIYLKAVLDI
jgi:hypothetical protein